MVLEELSKDSILPQNVFLHDLDVGLRLLEEGNLLKKELSEPNRGPCFQFLEFWLQFFDCLGIGGDGVVVEVALVMEGVLSFLRRSLMWLT